MSKKPSVATPLAAVADRDGAEAATGAADGVMAIAETAIAAEIGAVANDAEATAARTQSIETVNVLQQPGSAFFLSCSNQSWRRRHARQ